MKNIIILISYLKRTGFLREKICDFLEEFISKMKIEDIDERSLGMLEKELSNSNYAPITSPQCHWLSGVFQQNKIKLVANALLKLQDVTGEEIDRMMWVYLKINERLEMQKPI